MLSEPARCTYEGRALSVYSAILSPWSAIPGITFSMTTSFAGPTALSAAANASRPTFSAASRVSDAALAAASAAALAPSPAPSPRGPTAPAIPSLLAS